MFVLWKATSTSEQESVVIIDNEDCFMKRSISTDHAYLGAVDAINELINLALGEEDRLVVEEQATLDEIQSLKNKSSTRGNR